MTIVKEWIHDLVWEGSDLSISSNTRQSPKPGVVVQFENDNQSWGIVVATHEISQVTVLWSREPAEYYRDFIYDGSDDDATDYYLYDTDSPMIASTKDIKEIWREDNKHERRDDPRTYESEKKRLRHSRH